ncbi:hypothetical protein SXIM_45040 [Streptomyces xiamenensis]|uniref:Uncharacterized protein n=1 Tax=Streptomyces xiamenensis TaxID=408015 RepID=A0A0F7G0D8_9ACTN|nr:hypothetical protein SXIM_45040 [Streptomyces xiamenensis]
MGMTQETLLTTRAGRPRGGGGHACGISYVDLLICRSVSTSRTHSGGIAVPGGPDRCRSLCWCCWSCEVWVLRSVPRRRPDPA